MRLYIEKLIHGGLGLAKTADGAVFIEQGLPGETVDVRVVGKKSSTPYAVIEEIIDPSPFRQEPACPYYGVCGGCNLQHLLYQQQVKEKQAILKESFVRLGKFTPPASIDTVESPPWEYRIRAQLKIDTQQNTLGFYKKKSNEVISIAKCPLLDKRISTLLENSSSTLAKLNGAYNQIKVIAGDDAIIASTPIIPPQTKKETQITVGKKNFLLKGDSFFQGNRFLLEALGTWARTYVQGNLFIDMFGGLGFFSVLLGDLFSQGLLVEQSQTLVDLAQHNFTQNSLHHLKANALSAEHFFINPPKHTIDCLVVDPPRPGLTRKVREGIGTLKPLSILYVSCNPATLARDAGYFLNKCGYSIEDCCLFDLYPQTHHLETAMLLTLDSAK